MSTRAAIAVGTPEKWEGIYQHWDGYPAGLGKALWDMAHKKGVAKIRSDIFNHPGGFSSYPDECYCHTRKETLADGRLSSENDDPLFIEYVYVISEDNKTMFVLSSEMVGVEYKHKLMATIDLAGEEPNWDHLAGDEDA
jgi:hypothetical protein